MAISVFTHQDPCNPPSNQASLHYNGGTATNTTQGNLGVYFTTDAVLGLGDVITIPTQCNQGIDLVFVVDYTGSMGNEINGVKAGISNILSSISAESQNNARVGLVIFDEYSGTSVTSSNYSSKSTYINLPAGQKFHNVNTTPPGGRVQWITAMAPMGAVNDFTDFNAKLALLNDTTNFPLGNGNGNPEPGDLATYQVVANNFAGAWRAEAIKVVVLITDAVPGGDDDTNNATDNAYMNNTLIPALNSKSVQAMVQSTLSATSGGGNYYYNLATGTNIVGRYDQVTFDSSGNWINTGLIAGIQALCDETYYATCDLADTGWYYRSGDCYTVYFDNNAGVITNIYNLAPTYDVTPSTLSTDENGRTITWNVITSCVPDGTKLYWDFNPTGSVNSNDFINAISSGSFTISGNTGSFQLTTRADQLTEGTEAVSVRIRTGSTSGTIVATSDFTLISDTSVNVPTATPVPISVYTHYSVQSDGNGMIRYDSYQCGELTWTPFYSLRGSVLGLQVGDYVWADYARTTLFGGNGYFYQVADMNASYPQKVIKIGEGQVMEIQNCPVPAPTATPVPTVYYQIVNCATDQIVYTTTVPSQTGSRMFGTKTGATYVYLGATGTPGTIVETTDTGMTGCPATPTPTPTATSITSGTGSGYVYLVQCVGDGCTVGGTRIASDTQLLPNGTYVTLNNTAGCWEIMSTSSSTVQSTITGLCSGPPQPTPTPTAAPSTYVYLMDPCDGTSPYVVAQTNSPKNIGDVYDLTGSFYVDTNPYTIIAISSDLPETTIAQLTECPGGSGGGGKCLLAGTMITLADGTQKAIETIAIGDELKSMVIGDMPNSDDFEVLKLWSQANPTLSNTVTVVQDNVMSTVNSVLSFNNGRLTSSKDHLHLIKRSGNWMLLKASSVVVGDMLIDQNGSEIAITVIEELTGTFNVYKLDVEVSDTYIAGGIITHNNKPLP